MGLSSGGYTGGYLQVDLSGRSVRVAPTPAHLIVDYIGGRGFTSRLLWEMISPDTDPLGPENPLILATGPLSGLPVPGASRLTVAARSPLTGFLGDANCGGFFAPELKWAGYDYVVITGRSPAPVYLWIDDDRVELRDARHLWGKGTLETESLIHAELGDPRIRILACGPAGENLVRYACLVADTARVAGRSGLGAVMGSKHLKAVAVRGTRPVTIYSPARLEEAVEAVRASVDRDPFYVAFRRLGTTQYMETRNRIGALQTKNLQTGVWDRVERVGGNRLYREHKARSLGCFSCIINCGRLSVVRESPWGPFSTEGPEYDVLQAFGSKCLNDDLVNVLYLSRLSKDLGLDAISCGNTLAFAMECFDRGLLRPEQTEDLDLVWGHGAVMVELVGRIARRQGRLGHLLAEGSLRAGLALGNGAERYAMQVKGQELSSADPRGNYCRALSYAVASRGADHLRAYGSIDQLMTPEDAQKWVGDPTVIDPANPRGKGRLVALAESLNNLPAMLGTCQVIFARSVSFAGFVERNLYLETALYRAATGREISPEEMLVAGERLTNLDRGLNVRLGLTRRDDYLPERFLREPMPEGPARGALVPLDTLLDEYYAVRGWDLRTGWPREEVLHRLGLEEVARDLRCRGRLG